MSTLAYAAFTTRREQAAPGSSRSGSPPGVGTYVDALAALVPSEVLTLHGVILAVTTGKNPDGSIVITDAQTLRYAFAGLLALSAVLYVATRLRAGKWDRLDVARMLIPPSAFLGWTMLQRATAFDALFPTVGDAPRTVVALFIGVLLGLLASALAYQADQKPPQAR